MEIRAITSGLANSSGTAGAQGAKGMTHALETGQAQPQTDNLRRKADREANFFILIARNSLRSLESKK
jgi:hypothetical protein